MKFNYEDFDLVRQIALSFPDTQESVSHEGTPSVTLNGKLLCRLHESGEWISIRLDVDIRDQYLISHPELFFMPEHYRKWPYLFMVLHVTDKSLIREVLEWSWKSRATKKQMKAYH